jgi:hypothetical protein
MCLALYEAATNWVNQAGYNPRGQALLGHARQVPISERGVYEFCVCA